MLHGGTGAYLLEVLHDVAGTLDEVPRVQEARVRFGRRELRVRLEGGDEGCEEGGYVFLFLGGGDGHHGCGD